MLNSPERIASYCYSKSDKELVTYDTVDVAMRKAQYIKDGNLGYVYFLLKILRTTTHILPYYYYSIVVVCTGNYQVMCQLQIVLSLLMSRWLSNV